MGVKRSFEWNKSILELSKAIEVLVVDIELVKFLNVVESSF